MTGKIIIDGIDVSECNHIDDYKHCNCCNDLIKTIYPKATKCHIEEDLRCETYSNCYFKQLKQTEKKLQEKEQEYKKIQNRKQETINRINSLKEILIENGYTSIGLLFALISSNIDYVVTGKINISEKDQECMIKEFVKDFLHSNKEKE